MPTKAITITGFATWEDSGPNYPSQGPGFPTHPIAPGGPPLGIWGGAPPWVSHPIAPGGQPPYPSTGPGFPTHPIAPGGPPPGIWPGPGRPDQGLPGQPPGIWGGAPPWVDNTLPGAPPIPSTGPGFPTQPISGGGFVIGWSPTYGFVYIPLGGANPNPPVEPPEMPPAVP